MKQEISQNLIRQAVGGDAEAFGEIYFSMRDGIYGFSYRMTNSREIAEEITQEVFMFFVRFPNKFDDSRGNLFSFLCGVARNKIFNHLKKSGVRLETNDIETKVLDLKTSNGKTPLKILLEKEFSLKLEEAVANLSPLQREVLILRESENLSYEEIALITQTETATVKSRLYRARRALMNDLAPYLKIGERRIYELH